MIWTAQQLAVPNAWALKKSNLKMKLILNEILMMIRKREALRISYCESALLTNWINKCIVKEKLAPKQTKQK